MKVFMNDFSVHSTTFDHCLNNFSEIIQRCEDINLILNREKCHYMIYEGIVLGHIISNGGTEVDKEKVRVIKKLLPPSFVKGIRSFLGHVSFYRLFIKDFSKIAKHFTHLLVKGVPSKFNKERLCAFHRLKEALITAPIMQAPNRELPFEVMYDVTDYTTVGAVLVQRKGNKPYAIYYAS